ncbi:MAG: phosphate/phosphite/phosphonate ABC transporter substrate-binding protein [candidate division NC10 bacterium]|nr:phosphate/phosphite/phosphonate ABC transporter substrate-binding protein [candidate division NC10 bacterium]
MTRKGLVALSILALSLLLGCHPAPRSEARKTVKVAILPEYSLELMAAKYMDLVSYLSKETGYRIEYVSSLSYTNYLSTLEASRADVGFQNALVYQTLVKTRGAYPLCQAIGSDGSRTNRGIIITHKESGIESISDLKNKRVMVASKKAVSGYLAQAADCVTVGVDPDRDLMIIIGTRQDEVVKKVLRGEVDAGFIREDVLQMVGRKVDVSNIRIIHYTRPYPNWVVAAFRETDPEIAAKVKAALLRLNEETLQGRTTLRLMGLKGFAESQDSDYQEVREVASRLGLPL